MKQTKMESKDVKIKDLPEPLRSTVRDFYISTMQWSKDFNNLLGSNIKDMKQTKMEKKNFGDTELGEAIGFAIILMTILSPFIAIIIWG